VKLTVVNNINKFSKKHNRYQHSYQQTNHNNETKIYNLKSSFSVGNTTL